MGNLVKRKTEMEGWISQSEKKNVSLEEKQETIPVLKKIEKWCGTIDVILVRTFVLSVTAYEMIDFFVTMVFKQK